MTSAFDLQGSWETIWSSPHNKAPYGTSKQEWTENGYSCTTFYGLIIESGPNFKRLKDKKTNRNKGILKMHFDGIGKDYIFSNCLACKKRNFADPTFPFPLDLDIDDPKLPRLGKCGCVCCNGCVQKLIANSAIDVTNPDRGYIKCPNCAFKRSHMADTHAWIYTSHMLENRIVR